MSTTLRILSLIALLLVVVSVSARPAEGQDQQGQSETIELTGDGYDPEDLEVEVNTTIIWRNVSGDALELVAVDNWFSSLELAHNATYQKSDTPPGTYRYYTREPGSTAVNQEQGQIEVVDSSTATPTPTGTRTTSPSPSPTGTVTLSPSPSATGTLGPSPTVTTTVFPTLTPFGSVTATPTLFPSPTLFPTETPSFAWPTVTPYPTPGFPNTGGDDTLPPGRAVGVGLVLMLSALAVGMLYRRLRPSVAYRESDYEWRD